MDKTTRMIDMNVSMIIFTEKYNLQKKNPNNLKLEK